MQQVLPLALGFHQEENQSPNYHFSHSLQAQRMLE